MATDYQEIQTKLRDVARSLLRNGTVKYVVGYKKGTSSFRTAPAFIDSVDAVDQLIWSPLCYNNLSIYVSEEQKKLFAAEEMARMRRRDAKTDHRPIALVIKGCDSRAIVQLLQEHQMPREEVYVIGIPCEGMFDPKKLEKAWMKRGLPNVSAYAMDLTEKDGAFVGTYDGTTVTFDRDEVLADRCKECFTHNPLISDVTLRDAVQEQDVPTYYDDVNALEAMPLAEREAFWNTEFEKCIRCYACRHACPMCYCYECAADPTDVMVGPETTAFEKATRPVWVQRSNDLPETKFYHVVRGLHMMGRCVMCEACEIACPTNVSLRKWFKKVRKDTKAHFDYEAGMNVDDKPLFSSFREDDQEDFIR